MEQLPKDLQSLNVLIINAPQEVLRLLVKNNIKVPSKPTLSILTRLTLKNLTNDKFREDINRAMQDGGESGVVFAIISAVIGIVSIFTSSAAAKRQREAFMRAKQMELQQQEQIALANIQAMKEEGRFTILSNTILEYAKNLQSEGTKRQKDTGLFIGIMGVSLAVIYSAIQIFKNK